MIWGIGVSVMGARRSFLVLNNRKVTKKIIVVYDFGAFLEKLPGNFAQIGAPAGLAARFGLRMRVIYYQLTI